MSIFTHMKNRFVITEANLRKIIRSVLKETADAQFGALQGWIDRAEGENWQDDRLTNVIISAIRNNRGQRRNEINSMLSAVKNSEMKKQLSSALN